MTETESEENEIIYPIQNVKITNPEIYNNVYIPVNKSELKRIVEGHIETHDGYAGQRRTEIINLIKEGQKLQKKLTEIKEAKDALLELQMLSELEIDDEKEITEKQVEELHEYQREHRKLVKQLIELEITITKAVDESEARRKSLQPLLDPKWIEKRRSSWELRLLLESKVIISLCL